MWFEIAPPFAVIVLALGLPAYASYALNWTFLGNGYKRALLEPNQRRMYLRDGQRFGSPYRLVGLEAIPDEEPKRRPRRGRVGDDGECVCEGDDE